MKKKLILLLSAIALIALIGGAAIANAAPDTEDGFVRGQGRCIGRAAGDAASFEEFQQQKIDRLGELVDEGKLTQEEADAILENMRNCNGLRENRPEEGRGLFGKGAGQGLRNGSGAGCKR